MEIGSEFAMEKWRSAYQDGRLKWLPYRSDHVFVFSGRTAIENVLYDIGSARKALLPSYCCESMIEPFRLKNIAVEFYDVEPWNGMTIRMDIPADCDIILRCNYFGYSVKYAEEILTEFQKRGGIIVEDITHSLLSEAQYHENSDYLVASLRKWGPLFDGGFCSKRYGSFEEKPSRQPENSFLIKKREAMGLKAEYLATGTAQKKQEYLTLFAESNLELSRNYSGVLMSEASKELLRLWSIEEMRVRRKNNARILHEGMRCCQALTPLFSISAMDCPLYVPVIAENAVRESLRQKLTEAEIYCPIHWPRPAEKCRSDFYDRELSLVCDQRYGSADMERIVSIIKEY